MTRRATARGLPPTLIAAIVAGVAAIASIVAVLVWSAPDDDAPLPAQRAIPAPQVFDDPQRYLGREITVTGEVSVLTDRVMSLGDRDLIVVSAQRGLPPFTGDGYFVGDVVHATGELHMLDARGVVERLPHVSLLHSQFQEFERQPVLLAGEVVPSALDR